MGTPSEASCVFRGTSSPPSLAFFLLTSSFLIPSLAEEYKKGRETSPFSWGDSNSVLLGCYFGGFFLVWGFSGVFACGPPRWVFAHSGFSLDPVVGSLILVLFWDKVSSLSGVVKVGWLFWWKVLLASGGATGFFGVWFTCWFWYTKPLPRSVLMFFVLFVFLVFVCV